MRILHRLLFISFALLLFSCGDSDRSAPDSSFDNVRELNFTDAVSFYSSAGDSISTIEVAVADDDNSRSAGLMNVRNLPEDSGMLFIFDDEAERSFWMESTPLSLDILFVNADMEIIRIHQNTTPYSQENILSEEPAQYVMEVNAGYTIRKDITEGARIEILE